VTFAKPLGILLSGNAFGNPISDQVYVMLERRIGKAGVKNEGLSIQSTNQIKRLPS
ncbi:unnamed protein product, partial [marine sediment metagenome]